MSGQTHVIIYGKQWSLL